MTDTLVLRTGRIALGLAALTLIGVVGLRVAGNRAQGFRKARLQP